ncbi:MAG TPA: EamA family transporter [Actinomycetota bacterium]|nr:EamA family transporter [Actinomycetota bacterium]
MSTAQTRRPDPLTLAGFGTVVLLAGSNLVVVRLSNRGLPPFFGAGIRFLAASVLLFGWVLVRRLPLPTRRELPGTLLFGLLAFAGFFAFGYWGLVYLPAGIVGTLAASVPLMTLFFAAAQGLERITLRGLAGGAIAMAGIAVMLGAPAAAGVALWPALSILAAAACDAEANVVVKKLPLGHPVSTNAVGMLVGSLILLALSAVSREAWSLPDDTSTWWALAYLVTLGSVVLFVLFLWTIKRWTASGMSYMFVLMPVVASVLGIFILDEPVTASAAAGGFLVLLGVFVGALSGRAGAQIQAPSRSGLPKS